MLSEQQQLIELWNHTMFFFGSMYLSGWSYFGISPPNSHVVLSWAITIMLLIVIIGSHTNLGSLIKRSVRRLFSPRSWFKRFRLARGMQMDANERDGFLRSFIADGVTNFIEDAEYNGEITREEANRWYEHVAHACGLPDLIRMRIERNAEEIATKGQIEKAVKAVKPKRTNGALAVRTEPVPSEPLPTPPVKDVSSAANALRTRGLFKRHPKPTQPA